MANELPAKISLSQSSKHNSNKNRIALQEKDNREHPEGHKSGKFPRLQDILAEYAKP
jgi:hypothetical protein